LNNPTVKWYGRAGHFICGDQCLFHLCTQVDQYLISTVGDYYPKLGVPKEKIGYNRFYETMVFKIIGVCSCGCGLPGIDPTERDSNVYNDPISATEGHQKLVDKYIQMCDGFSFKKVKAKKKIHRINLRGD
jgi:hypothetical protein